MVTISDSNDSIVEEGNMLPWQWLQIFLEVHLICVEQENTINHISYVTWITLTSLDGLTRQMNTIN